MNKLSSLIVGLGLVVSSLLHPLATYHSLLSSSAPHQSLGVASTSFTPVQAKPTTLAGAGATISATSLNVTAFVTPALTPIIMSNFGDIGYVTLEPGTSKEENVSFTGITQNGNGTAILTGVSRGLSFTSPYAASSSLAHAHAGGSVVVTSNSAPFYSQFAFQLQNASITGVYTFATSSIPRLNGDYVYTTGDERKLVTYGQLASTTFAGTVNASFSQKGIIQLSTTSEFAAGTSLGSTGAFLVPPNALFSPTSSANIGVIAQSNGKISQTFWDLTQGFTFSGGLTSSATTTLSGNNTLSGTTTISGPLTISGTVSGTFPGIRVSSSSTTPLTANGTTTVFSVTIPAGTLSTSSLVHAEFDFTSVPNNSNHTVNFALLYGGTNMVTSTQFQSTGAASYLGRFFIDLIGNGSTSSEKVIMTAVEPQTTNGTSTPSVWYTYATGTAAVNSSVAQTFSLIFSNNDSGGSYSVDNWWVAKITN